MRSVKMSVISVFVFICLIVTPVSVLADEPIPVSPCRVLDTRNTSNGYVPPGMPVNFKIRDYYSSGFKVHPGSSQGGDSNCGIPTSATAVHLSIVAINPSSIGHVYMWPYGQAQPTTSALNVSATETSNSGLFSLLGSGSHDLTIKGSGISAYYVVDILGYTSPSLASLVGQAVGVPFTHVLAVQTTNGNTVLAYAPNSLPTYRASWVSNIPNAVGNCVEVLGYWTDGNTVGEAGVFEARSLPQVMNGYCGPN